MSVIRCYPPKPSRRGWLQPPAKLPLHPRALRRRVADPLPVGLCVRPRCIQLDYVIRESDPLLKAAGPVMRELRDRNGCDVLLASMFGDSIVAIHHERGTDPTTISYSRGRQMPLFRGAGSKAILATLPCSRQQRIVEAHADALASSAIGHPMTGHAETNLASMKTGKYQTARISCIFAMRTIGTVRPADGPADPRWRCTKPQR